MASLYVLLYKIQLQQPCLTHWSLVTKRVSNEPCRDLHIQTIDHSKPGSLDLDLKSDMMDCRVGAIIFEGQ